MNNTTDSEEDSTTNVHTTSTDCTLAYVRALTAPPLTPPSIPELSEALMESWKQRGVKLPIAVDTRDCSTMVHWKKQPKDTPLCQSLLSFVDFANNNDEDHAEQQSTPPPKQVMRLEPYFPWGDPSSPFFAPHEDVIHGLKHLLLHQIGSFQSTFDHSFVLVSHHCPVFVATSSANYQPGHFYPSIIVASRHLDGAISTITTNDNNNNTNNGTKHNKEDMDGYILRCHYDKPEHKLIFGYHAFYQTPEYAEETEVFHRLQSLELDDNDWKIKASLLLTNSARIIHCLKAYTLPLIYSMGTKLQLVHGNNNNNLYVQKTYTSPTICGIFGATVESMIQIYETLEEAQIPHTDRLVSVQYQHSPASVGHQEEDEEDATTSKENQEPIPKINKHDVKDDIGTAVAASASSVDTTPICNTTKTICQFGPIGRCYLPTNTHELLDALGCVMETLLAMHSHNPPIMHRDIRWANVFRATAHDQEMTSREWILFDFEFAATAPQPAFAQHTLTPGNHAPEMIVSDWTETKDDDDNISSHFYQDYHDTAVDIWGVGYLLAHAHVDLPQSHKADLMELQQQCLQSDPSQRPSTRECYQKIKALQAKPLSKEKNVLTV